MREKLSHDFRVGLSRYKSYTFIQLVFKIFLLQYGTISLHVTTLGKLFIHVIHVPLSQKVSTSVANRRTAVLLLLTKLKYIGLKLWRKYWNKVSKIIIIWRFVAVLIHLIILAFIHLVLCTSGSTVRASRNISDTEDCRGCVEYDFMVFEVRQNSSS